jgi:hypothetical protein
MEHARQYPSLGHAALLCLVLQRYAERWSSTGPRSQRVRSGANLPTFQRLRRSQAAATGDRSRSGLVAALLRCELVVKNAGSARSD